METERRRDNESGVKTRKVRCTDRETKKIQALLIGKHAIPI